VAVSTCFRKAVIVQPWWIDCAAVIRVTIRVRGVISATVVTRIVRVRVRAIGPAVKRNIRLSLLSPLLKKILKKDSLKTETITSIICKLQAHEIIILGFSTMKLQSPKSEDEDLDNNETTVTQIRRWTLFIYFTYNYLNSTLFYLNLS
jgi:hypothetical protein